MQQKAKIEPLTLDEMWEYATSTEELCGKEQALPLYREIIKLHPAEAGAHYAIGRILLSQNNEEGISLLEKGMQADERYIVEGCRYIIDFLLKQNREDDIPSYEERLMKRWEIEEKARQERAWLKPTDTYLPHLVIVCALIFLMVTRAVGSRTSRWGNVLSITGAAIGTIGISVCLTASLETFQAPTEATADLTFISMCLGLLGVVLWLIACDMSDS